MTAQSDGSLFERTLGPSLCANNSITAVGVAYRLAEKIVIRGGYGIFYQQRAPPRRSQLALNPPQLIDVNLNANSRNDSPAMILRNGFAPVSAANVNPAAVQWRIQDPDQETPTVQQFSISQYQISRSMVIGADYVGNITRDGRELHH